MCGIFGWQFVGGSVSLDQRRLLAALLSAANDGRGGDSWGFYDPRANRRTRGLGELSLAVRPERLARLDTVLVHTRRATTGKVVRANAHPFRVRHIVGAHNGMVSNHLELNLWHGRAYPVDSMHLFGHLADDLPLTEIEGYGAVQYVYRDRPERVWLARFNGGELAVSAVPGGIVWSSDRADLRRSLALAEIEEESYRVEEGARYYVEDGVLHDPKLAFGVAPYRRWEWTGKRVEEVAF